MKKKRLAILLLVLVLVGTTAGVLGRVRSGQKLGAPGVKTSPIPGSSNVVVELPETVSGYTSRWIEPAEVVTNSLPRDTSYGQRIYKAADGFEVMANVVLMGSDRTSLHKPQFCLRGGGWKIDTTEPEVIPVARPTPHDLDVMKLKISPAEPGTLGNMRGVYVYWYVAEDRATSSHFQRMWWLASDLLTRQVLQRWAYVTFFAVCPPGQEEATYQRMKTFIVEAVPEFQLVPPPPGTASGSPAVTANP